jgi:hypothetical protein
MFRKRRLSVVEHLQPVHKEYLCALVRVTNCQPSFFCFNLLFLFILFTNFYIYTGSGDNKTRMLLVLAGYEAHGIGEYEL